MEGLGETGDIPLNMQLFEASQDAIRARWRTSEPRTFTMGYKDPEKFPHAKPSVDGWLVVTADGLEIVTTDIYNYMLLAATHDAARGKLHICRNPKCETPYFRETRAGQVYCSHTCAVAVSVARFQARKKAKTKKGGTK